VGGFGPIEVPLEEFRKLTKIPMQMVWGDNVDKHASSASSLTLSTLFAEKITKYGGKAQVLMLPEPASRGTRTFPSRI
jgi:hypothetical protein